MGNSDIAVYQLQRLSKDVWLTMRDSLGAYRFYTIDDALYHRKFWADDAIHTNDYRVINCETGEVVA